MEHDASPPSLFWESDVAKWIEAACYFLSTAEKEIPTHGAEYRQAIDELLDMIETAQQSDGYLNVYFTVVDPDGKLKNLRDFHELYNAGHLIEAALAHHLYTGSSRFLDIMIRNVEFFRERIGPGKHQLHGYSGHPEIELALIRLHSVTQNPDHLSFAQYLLEERGRKRDEQDGECWFLWEPKQRGDYVTPSWLTGIDDLYYNQSHATLHEQKTIIGHAVRALYLITGAADLGGEFLEDARRLWADAVDKKMYVTGGLGSVPRTEGFSNIPHWLPQSTGEGGCYAETCASIACMMVSERLLSHQIDGKVRDIMELCLYNNVLGGGSLDGKQFSYANKLATWGDEVATRNDWFEVCCCPPNLSRTMGMLGGYTWSVKTDTGNKVIFLDVYLFLSAIRTILLPDGQRATVKMVSKMPWAGQTDWTFSAPSDWCWHVRIPQPNYAENIKVSEAATLSSDFLSIQLPSTTTVSLSFDMPIEFLAPHYSTGRDTLTVFRGPIIYTIESCDNPEVDTQSPHFERVGLSSESSYTVKYEKVGGLEVLMVVTEEAFILKEEDPRYSYHVVKPKSGGRTWQRLPNGLTFVPWFARANRGGGGRLRTALLRSDN